MFFHSILIFIFSILYSVTVNSSSNPLTPLYSVFIFPSIFNCFFFFLPPFLNFLLSYFDYYHLDLIRIIPPSLFFFSFSLRLFSLIALLFLHRIFYLFSSRVCLQIKIKKSELELIILPVGHYCLFVWSTFFKDFIDEISSLPNMKLKKH